MNRNILKKILIIIFLLLFSQILNAFTLSDLNIQNSKDSFVLKLKLPQNFNISKKVYYEYGVNIFLNNVSFDKIYLRKVNSQFVNNIKIVPIKKDLTLLKIQTNSPFNKNKFNLQVVDSTLIISYGNKPYVEKNVNKVKRTKSIIPAINPISNKTKISTTLLKDSKEDKIIEELTKKPLEEKLPVVPVSKPVDLNQNKILNKKDISSAKKSFDFTSRIIKTYSMLAIMCIFLIGIGFVFKRLKNKNFIMGKSDIFKVVYRYEIEPKKALAIIKVYNDYLLVGITEYNINLIAKIESEDIKNEIRLIEGEREKNKFIKYLKEQNKRQEEKNEKIDKELLISSIEEKIKKYKKMIS